MTKIHGRTGLVLFVGGGGGGDSIVCPQNVGEGGEEVTKK